VGHYLRKLGVGPETLVGLCVERGPGLVVGLLGILKAGGAYVPLDPAYPVARLSYMLEDAGPAVLLTEAQLAERMPAYWGWTVKLDEEWDEIAPERRDNPQLV
jgi:Non-ribosomal peptide synthetase modules and related proteins